MALNTRSAGFQGSETSSVELTFYTHGDEPGLNQPTAGKIEIIGRGVSRPGAELAPALIALDTQKALGGPAGNWQAVIKAPRSLNFREWIADDDWCDIVMSRHARRFHVLRGLVDSVRRTQTVTDGATTQDWLISGRDFQKVFEDTQVFFNRFAAENVWGGATLQAFLAQENAFQGSGLGFDPGSVPANVFGFLNSLLEALGEFGRSTWELPAALPGVFTDDTFVNALRFNFVGFTDSPKRIAARPWFHSFRGVSDQTVWSLAEQWSDPPMCELYTELLLDNGERFPGSDDETGADLNGNVMTVVVRDRPFPTAEPPHGSVSAGPWWGLPLFLLARQEVLSDDIGRSGRERKNAFLFQPQITQELVGQSIQVAKPMWDATSIRRHGVRPHYVTSQYTVIGGQTGVINLADEQRRKVRDWYCLNHLFYNGTIAIPRGAPDIRIGSRVRIVDEQGPEGDETYYVESVAHSWRLQTGLRTHLGVTRGWIGTDQGLRSALNEARDRYEESSPALPDADAGVAVV